MKSSNNRISTGHLLISIYLLLVLTFILAIRVSAQNPGQAAYNFTLPTLDGKDSIELQKLRGKVVLLDFWATWCPPCKKAMPFLDELNSKYKNLEVVAVNVDDERNTALAFAEKLRLKLTMVYDGQKNIIEKYNVPEMPTSFLIDQYGYIQFVHAGYTEKDFDQMEFKIRGLLDLK